MADEQQTPQALNPDLAGYPSVEHLVAGYRASGEEAKRQKERADQAERLLSGLVAAENQRQPIPSRAQDPMQRLREEGWPSDTLQEAIRFESQKIANEMFAPIAQGFQARNQLLGQYPDYQKFEADVAQFINSDPDVSQRYQKMFASDPVGAMEYAFLKFGEDRRRTHPNGAANPHMGEAMIPSTRTGDARSGAFNQDDAQRAWERYQQTGNTRDAQAFAHARLKNVISDEFLGQ